MTSINSVLGPKEIESTQLIIKDEGQEFTLREALSAESGMPTTSLSGFWGLIEQEVLKFLANHIWRVKKEILEALYPTDS